MTKDRPKGGQMGGIVAGHCYTLKSVKEELGVCLVELRNPWGEHEWQGDWSDRSPLWTQEMKDAFHPTLDEGTSATDGTESEDGLFWMSAADFFQFFDGVSVVYHDAKTAKRVSCITKGCSIFPELVEFVVSQPTSGYVTLIQHDTRIRGKDPYIGLGFGVYGPCSGEHSLPSNMVLQSAVSQGAREVFAKISKDAPLQPGRYMIAIFNQTKCKDREVTLVVHTDTKDCRFYEKVHLEKDKRDALMLAHALTGEASTLGPLEIKEEWLPNGGRAVSARNISDKGDATVDFNFSSCKGIRIRGDGHPNKLSDVSFPKGGDMKLICELVPDRSGSGLRNYGMRMSYRV